MEVLLSDTDTVAAAITPENLYHPHILNPRDALPKFSKLSENYRKRLQEDPETGAFWQIFGGLETALRDLSEVPQGFQLVIMVPDQKNWSFGKRV